ncbi:helix-turn-helix domain-containing protein [Chamaesiphon sp.]|uniref:helix-turn-helix domain-containing protein n=1 Tax=Chamaesiphon sp. TaxID=2814140 RepID=UPI0035933759
MSSERQLDLTLQLKELMQKVGINSFKQLYRSTGTSADAIGKLRSGNLNTLRWQTLVNISDTLEISVNELIDTFGEQLSSNKTQPNVSKSSHQALKTLQHEYQHLQHQFQQQREILQAEFQYQSLQTLESFLTYFPTAKYAAAQNHDFPASKILPLVQSIDRLIQQWDVSIIGTVGARVEYDPRWHQLIAGTATPEELVTVRYVGYRQDDKLIFRAKVSN